MAGPHEGARCGRIGKLAREQLEVATGTEASPGAGQNDRAYTGVAAEIGQRRLQLLRHFPLDRVARRPVERQRGDAGLVVLGEMDGLERHVNSPAGGSVEPRP